MFQTIGLRNQLWRQRLDRVALIYGWVVFLGFAIIPAAVLSGLLMNDPRYEQAISAAHPNIPK